MQTIRQAFILLRQNPLLSTIFILGTAFAITMIMAIVITWQMKYADIEPEVNRNRSLYISKMHLQGKENKNWNNYTACSPAFMKNCVQPLPEVEACTAFVPATVALVSMPDGTNAVKVDAMETDPGFWKVFRMQLCVGQRGAGFADVVHTVRSGIAHCSFSAVAQSVRPEQQPYAAAHQRTGRA